MIPIVWIGMADIQESGTNDTLPTFRYDYFIYIGKISGNPADQSKFIASAPPTHFPIWHVAGHVIGNGHEWFSIFRVLVVTDFRSNTYTNKLIAKRLTDDPGNNARVHAVTIRQDRL